MAERLLKTKKQKIAPAKPTAEEPKYFAAEFVGIKNREELKGEMKWRRFA